MVKTKISPHSWNASLRLLLDQLTAKCGGPPRVAVLGVGNPLRSDDAAGILVARALQACSAETENLLIVEAGHAPENRTGEIRAFAPDLVMLIDAAEMGQTPGTIQWVPEEFMDGMSASTHSLPLSVLARYLTLELNCQVVLLGIQPCSNEIGETVHTEVIQAIDELVRGLKATLPHSISQAS